MIGGVIREIGAVAARAIPDATRRLELRREMAEIADRAEAREYEAMQGQVGVNAIDAGSGDRFSRRWRPLIGYVCAVALAYATVLRWAVHDLARLFGSDYALTAYDHHLLEMVLVGMLGLGGLRSIDKWRRPAGPAARPAPAVSYERAGEPLEEGAPVMGQRAGEVRDAVRRRTLKL